MKVRSIFALFFIVVLVAGCKKVDISDKPAAEARLTERVKEYETALFSPDKENAWEIRSESFKKRFPKNEYIEFLKGDILYGGDYKREYDIDTIEIRNNGAKVKVIHSLQPVQGGETEVSPSYYFWIFEKGDWYLAETGQTGRKADWW